ncbi:MAG: Gfo/Idh/MocA family oxidoreductase [Chitinophagales bacterium]|nr:Gfo/Idh/MocA family oxidoreductase [Chitinophagales bacterium]
MNCAIIGSGQLGSRHLQGLLKYQQEQLNIYVYDTSAESLAIANSRASEINHNHQIHYIQDFTKLPQEIFFVVVATNSIVRASVVEQLIQHATIHYLILEKVLFPEIDSYSTIGQLLREHGIKTYVNHPRRMFASYKNMKQHLLSTTKHHFLLHGGQWGLACNALHFIDIFEYLSDSQLMNIDTSLLDTIIHESKRQHYIEFTGTLRGNLLNGTTFSITSSNTAAISPPGIALFNDCERLLIDESGRACITKYSTHTPFQEEKIPFTMEYQSSLTNKLFSDVFTTGRCDLPEYQHAATTHICFLQALLTFYNQLTKNFDNRIIPIT